MFFSNDLTWLPLNVYWMVIFPVHIGMFINIWCFDWDVGTVNSTNIRKSCYIIKTFALFEQALPLIEAFILIYLLAFVNKLCYTFSTILDTLDWLKHTESPRLLLNYHLQKISRPLTLVWHGIFASRGQCLVEVHRTATLCLPKEAYCTSLGVHHSFQEGSVGLWILSLYAELGHVLAQLVTPFFSWLKGGTLRFCFGSGLYSGEKCCLAPGRISLWGRLRSP